jgi:hypothetical protein
MAMLSPRPILICLIALSLFVAAVEVAAYDSDFLVADNALSLWGLIFPILLAWWVVNDSRDKPYIYKPFSFGFLVLYSLPVYLPYYLFRTRGAAGALSLAGFILLYLLGFLLQLGMWAAG